MPFGFVSKKSSCTFRVFEEASINSSSFLLIMLLASPSRITFTQDSVQVEEKNHLVKCTSRPLNYYSERKKNSLCYNKFLKLVLTEVSLVTPHDNYPDNRYKSSSCLTLFYCFSQNRFHFLRVLKEVIKRVFVLI